MVGTYMNSLVQTVITFLLVLKGKNISSQPKNWCRDEFSQTQSCKCRPHAKTRVPLHWDLCTPCTPPTGPHAHTHKHTRFCPPFNSGLRQDHGRLNPRLQSPFPCPLPLTPSAKDHCLLSLSSTVLLVRWGPSESLHYCLVLHCGPLPYRPGLTPFTALKSTICITQQSGSERQERRGKKIWQRERRCWPRREERKRQREQEASACVLSCLSESICQTVFTVWRLPYCFPFFKHCAYWFFLQPSFNFYFPLSSNPLRFFPLYVFPRFKFSQTALNHCSLDPLLSSIYPLLHPPPPPSPPCTSFILLWCCMSIAGSLVWLHVWGRRIFPMGPQVKTGTHSVRQGTPSVPVAALARGEARHPSSCPLFSIHPTLCPSTCCPLSSHWSTVLNHQECTPHPSATPITFLLSSYPFPLRPVTNLSLESPTPFYSPPTLASFVSPPPISLSLLSISNQSSIYDTGGKIIKLSWICDEPGENKG